jgi:hypothetical protein
VKGVVQHRNVSWVPGPNKKTPREYARGLRADVPGFIFPALGLLP